MRVMVLIKADQNSEAGVLPDEQLMADMGRYNEELVEAGIMLAGEGLHPSSKGKRVAFDGPGRTASDGPFAPTRARAPPRRAGASPAPGPAAPSPTARSPGPASSSPASGCGGSGTWTRRSNG